MLTLCLILQDDAADLELALPNLGQAIAAGCACVVVDRGSSDASLDVLHGFLLRTGAQLMRAERSTSAAEALALAASVVDGTSFLLPISAQERIYLAGIGALLSRLATNSSQLLITRRAFYVADPDHPVQAPEAKRSGVTGPSVSSLHPDMRQILRHAKDMRKPEPTQTLAQTWAAFHSLVQSESLSFFAETPLLLRPIPKASAAHAFQAATAFVAEGSEADARLAHCLPWLDDALALSPPEAAFETLAEAESFLASLPAPLQAKATDATSVTSRLLHSLAQDKKSEALAQLALLGQARSNMINDALAQSQRALLRAVDRALPSSDYLRDLYHRTRGDI